MAEDMNELKTLMRMNTSNFFKLINDLEKQKRISIQKAFKLKRRSKHYQRKAAFLTLNLLHRRPTDSRVCSLEKKDKYWEDVVPHFDDNQFKNDFRMERATFEWLVGKLQCLERQNTMLRHAIPLQKRLGITLYVLGSFTDYPTVGHVFGIGRTTAGEIVRDFCKALIDNLFTEYVNAYPATSEKIHDMVRGFEKLGFSQCYGVLDGRSIELRSRKEGNYPLMMLSTVDYKSKFSYLSFSASDSSSHSKIFDRSGLKSIHERSFIFKKHTKQIDNITIPILLVGDSTFELAENVMIPYPNGKNPGIYQKNFNRRWRNCKNVADKAFSELYGRWKRLLVKGGLDMNVESARLIAKACCLLHNICVERGDVVRATWLEDANAGQDSPEQPSPSQNTPILRTRARSVRNQLAKYFTETKF